ncbi:MAG: hypothetical protein QW767_02410 [Thermoprotei archaeon]
MGGMSLVFFLLGLAVIAVPLYSAASFKIVQTGASQTEGSSILIPLEVINGGFLAVNDLQVNVSLLSPSGTLVASGLSSGLNVPAGSRTNITITVTPRVPLSELTSQTNLTVRTSTSMNIGGLLPIEISEESHL